MPGEAEYRAGAVVELARSTITALVRGGVKMIPIPVLVSLRQLIPFIDSPEIDDTSEALARCPWGITPCFDTVLAERVDLVLLGVRGSLL